MTVIRLDEKTFESGMEMYLGIYQNLFTKEGDVFFEKLIYSLDQMTRAGKNEPSGYQ